MDCYRVSLQSERSCVILDCASTWGDIYSLHDLKNVLPNAIPGFRLRGPCHSRYEIISSLAPRSSSRYLSNALGVAFD
jgi:hypothetical protein